MEPIVIVQGGAGDIPISRVPGKISGVKLAANAGYAALKKSNNVLDAVEEAIKVMELDDNFNAGYGSVLTRAGTVEMEASVMDSSGKVGCVTLIKNIMHPISIARKVMEKTPHNFLGGDKAIEFAVENGFEVLPEGSLITEYAKQALEQWKQKRNVKFAPTEVGPGEVGTVGAIAMDQYGNIAVGTSTGGITGKYEGRIGDTPIIGAGTYCAKNIGVSTTGHGETIMKSSLAHDIVKRFEYLKSSAQEATKDGCEEMTRLFEGTGGAITIANGDVGVYFTSKRMAWAYKNENDLVFGIEKGEIQREKI